jgi:polysaccharide pyruvyl transferase WcaK-like protein
MYYLIGTSGHPNYGDELITAMWLRYLAHHRPDVEVYVDCPAPGQAALLLGDLHPKARFVDTVYRLCWEAPSENPRELASWVQAAVHNAGMVPRWVTGVEALVKASTVHVIGGGYINSMWPRHVGLLAAAATAAQISGGQAIATGQGLTPASDAAAAVIQSLAHLFSVFDVRDQPSAQLLGDLATLSCDDAFLCYGPRWLDHRPGAREFMLCLQSDLLDLNRADLASTVSSTLHAWGVRGGQLGVVEGIPRVDREVYALLEFEFPGARFYPFTEIWRHGLPAAAGQTWISTRFHPHLMAAAAGAHGVAISVNPDYYATKHHSLTELGSAWSFSDGITPFARPRQGGYAAQQVQELVARKQEVATRCYRLPTATSPTVELSYK